MKLFGALLAVCAAAAVIPYKVEIDKENKTFKAKSLTYELSSQTDENGEKNVNICFFPEAKKSCECECEDFCEACEDVCEDICDACEDIAEEVTEAVEEIAEEVTED